MRRLLIALPLLLLAAAGAQAQEQPRVIVDMAAAETVAGQPLTLRIKVLVPTWLLAPPEFPSLEVPGLMVRLPAGASRPVSERIGPETWSGVQRAYRLYPLQPGRFEIGGHPIRITYSKPGGTGPVPAEAALPPVAFDAVVPKAARGLTPLVMAKSFALEAAVEGADGLEVGGAVVRTLTARIEGTTPVLIPQLTPEMAGSALRSYPDEAKISETEVRGVLSGTRRERTTFLARTVGSAVLPAVTIEWFNLDTGMVETAAVPAVPLTIAPGPAAQGGLPDLPWRTVLAAAGLGAVLAVLVRALWPRLAAWAAAASRRRRSSELYAHRRVMAAIRRRDLGAVHTALDQWRGMHHEPPGPNLQRALAQVGAGRYSGGASGPEGAAWSVLRAAYADARKALLVSERRSRNRGRLPPLNPDWE